MPQLIADIFVTIKDRWDLTLRSLYSLQECTDRTQYRLTLCFDGDNGPAPTDVHDFLHECADYTLMSNANEGLGPTINRAVSHIVSMNEWYIDPRCGDTSKVAPFICMCQDDLLYSKGWLPALAARFVAYEKSHRLGFASGVECIEHPVRQDLGGGVVTKDWIRAAQMLGRRAYWQSMTPIPPYDPETGRMRAKPNDGVGSGVDWWLIRNHENSVCKTGRTCLVIPGLVTHMGYDRSTWLSRQMPESESDKAKVAESRKKKFEGEF